MTQTNNDGSSFTSTDPQVAQDMIDQINRRIRRQERQIFDQAEGNVAYAYQGDMAGAGGIGGGAGGSNGLGEINNDFMAQLQAMIRQAVAEGMQGAGAGGEEGLPGADVNGLPGADASGAPGGHRGGRGGIGRAGGAGGHGGMGMGGMRRKKHGMGGGFGSARTGAGRMGGKKKGKAKGGTAGAGAVDCTDPANAQVQECIDQAGVSEAGYAYAYPGYGQDFYAYAGEYGQEFYGYAAKDGAAKGGADTADAGGDTAAAPADAAPAVTCMTPDNKPCTCDTPAATATPADTAGDTASTGSKKKSSSKKKSKKAAYGYAYQAENAGYPDDEDEYFKSYNTGNTFDLNMPTNPMSSSVYSNTPYHQMTPFKVVTA